MTPITIFNFSKTGGIGGWAVVDDVVMGGRSAGSFEVSDEGHGHFFGKVSLENNGGFSSVRCRMNVKLGEQQKFVIRLKGDGKKYNLRVKDSENNYYSYTSAIETSGTWQIVEIPFARMFATFRGQTLDLPNYAGKQIQEIGFLIGNKKAEDFSLMIDKIEVW